MNAEPLKVTLLNIFHLNVQVLFTFLFRHTLFILSFSLSSKKFTSGSMLKILYTLFKNSYLSQNNSVLIDLSVAKIF